MRMRFTLDSTAGVNLIRAYRRGEIRVNDETFKTSVIVSASQIHAEPGLHGVDDLEAELAARVLALRPELVLLGTGERQIFPAPSFGAQFLGAGIGFEVMDTGAACRTFNVLVAEQRLAVAVLMT
jgi:uncharacterized protein